MRFISTVSVNAHFRYLGWARYCTEYTNCRSVFSDEREGEPHPAKLRKETDLVSAASVAFSVFQPLQPRIAALLFLFCGNNFDRWDSFILFKVGQYLVTVERVRVSTNNKPGGRKDTPNHTSEVVTM